MDFDPDYGDAYEEDNLMYTDESEDEMYSTSEDGSPVFEGITFTQLLEDCIQPTLAGAMSQVWFPVLMCLVFRFTTRFIPMRLLFCHYVSTICGLACFIHMMGYNAIFTVIVCVSTYWFTYSAARKPRMEVFRGTLFMSLLYLVCREYFSLEIITESWEEVRGIQMILVLKTVSLSYDLIRGLYVGDSVPLKAEYLGYIFCPATFLFGPWISYADYLSIFDRSRPMMFDIVKQIPRLLLSSFLCLAFSSCGVYWLFMGSASKWIVMVRDAMSVRFSHYFICYLSEAMCVIAGLTSDNGRSRIKVVDVLKIEFPRSLSEVVVSWNKPMHLWLKEHAYLPAARLGAGKAVLTTFLISAMLHGLNFQLSAVLLSLGVYCYVEHTMRDKLACIFSACIKSRPCSSPCSHEYKGRNLAVTAVNFFLSCIAYFHLSYLGIMMDTTNVSDQPVGLLGTIVERLGHWGNLGYASHWLIVFTALTNSLV